MKRYNFTLIELVVSIAILIVIAGIVGVSGAAFYNGYERSQRVTNHLKMLMAIDNLMDTHIRNMIPFKWKDEEGNSRLLFDGEENRIFFTTLRRSYGDRPGALIFVRVFVEDEKLIAEYSPYPRMPWLEEDDESMPMTREVLAENVLQVTFNYAEKSTENDEAVDFLEEFREEENSVLPLAVLMKIEFVDGSKEQWLRRVAGVSKNSTFGYRPAPEKQSENNGDHANTANSGQNSQNRGNSRGSGRNSRGGGGSRGGTIGGRR
ncbi:MAG: hypothetical protein J6W00_04080 [Lentisphaeria bacterium]|nr:hypothetical protein [Lentisphaeria bacterium]